MKEFMYGDETVKVLEALIRRLNLKEKLIN